MDISIYGYGYGYEYGYGGGNRNSTNQLQPHACRKQLVLLVLMDDNL